MPKLNRKIAVTLMLLAMLAPLFLVGAKPASANSPANSAPITTEKKKPKPDPTPTPKPGPREGGADG